jgi:outer membrane lipoprotein-sorting protein
MCANLTPAAMSFLTGKGTLAASFTPSVAGTTSTTIELELTPKQKSAQYKKLVLTVDSATYLVQKSVVTDTADNTNEFAFSNVNTAATIPATTFKVNLTALHNKAYSVTKHTGSCAKASAPSGGGSGSGATSGSAGTE